MRIQYQQQNQLKKFTKLTMTRSIVSKASQIIDIQFDFLVMFEHIRILINFGLDSI